VTDAETLITIEEFERLPEDEWRTELVRGRVVREPLNTLQQGSMACHVGVLVANYVERHELGELFNATGWVLSEDPPTVRAPHIAFLSKDRLPPPEESAGFGRMAPDLAIVILSPTDTETEITDKTLDYLDAGTRLLWVVEPSRRSVLEYRSHTQIRLLEEDDALNGYDVLPGFSLRVTDLFADSPAS
jgi:Uma2 family endonuclease